MSHNLQEEVNENLVRYRKQREEFIELIRRQEEVALQNPTGYRRKVIAFAWLGYLYVFGVILLLLSVLIGIVMAVVVTGKGGIVVAKIAIFVLPVIYFVFRALFVRIEPPVGERVSRDQAPELWRDVDDLATQLGAPKIDEIVVDLDMNAAAAQFPRLGIFGFYRNSLILGLPLIFALPKDEMRSVIAHEFGHFSGQHGRTGGWIYRLNETYARIRESLGNSHGSGFFRSFYNWFQPRFDAISFAMRRQNEYEADAAAAKLVGSAAAARALMRLSYLDKAFEKGTWDRLQKLNSVQRDAPRDAFSNLSGDMVSGTETVDIEKELRRALHRKTGYDDTHPSLTDRLKGMGQLPGADLDRVVSELKKPIEQSAAEAYFGARLAPFVDRWNRRYEAEGRQAWEASHDHKVNAATELQKLETKAESEELTKEEKTSRAFLTLHQVSAEAALPRFRELVAEHPHDPDALYGLGETLLTLDDPEGEEHLRESMKLRLDYVAEATQLIANYRLRSNEETDISVLREEFVEKMQVVQLVEREHRVLRLTDNYVPSLFGPEQIDNVREQLKTWKVVKEAYLVAKAIDIEGSPPVNILVVIPTKTLVDGENRNEKLVDKLVAEIQFPGHSMVYIPNDPKNWSKRMKTIPGAQLI